MCPTNYYAVVTRDGSVCVHTIGATLNNCPLPNIWLDDAGEFMLSQAAYTRHCAADNANSLPVLQLTAAGTPTQCTVATGCTDTPAPATVSNYDLYDCVATAATSTTGVCCPNRGIYIALASCTIIYSTHLFATRSPRWHNRGTTTLLLRQCCRRVHPVHIQFGHHC